MQENEQSPSVAVTGANGYLGASVVDYFRQRGFTVYRLTGSVHQYSSLDPYTIPYSLAEPPSPNLFAEKQIRALIHCAYDFRADTWNKIEQVNVHGSVELIKSARAGGVDRIVFISTMSAFRDCQSLYGKAKLMIENESSRLGATTVRPGLIYSDKPGAMMGRLTKAVQHLPVLPKIIGGHQTLYLVHQDDLNSLLFSLVTGETIFSKPIIAACENGKTLAEILQLIAAREHKQILLLPVPWRLIWICLKTLETCGIKLGFRSDSIVSLANQDPAPDFAESRKTSTHFRAFS
jgi:nucleoside-diphosphate-sugar epimerase